MIGGRRNRASFSNEILSANGLQGDPIVAGTLVFEIDASSIKKVAFAENAKTLDAAEFANFQYLFDRITAIPI